MTKAKVGAMLCILLMTAPRYCWAADLTIMAEDAAEPFSGPDGTGYVNDLVKAAFLAAGVEIAFDVVPYARCKRDVEDGKTPACFTMSWYKGVEESVVFSKLPVSQVYADIFVNRRSPRPIGGMGDFKSGTLVGIVNEYEYPDEILRLAGQGVVLQPASNDGANLKMLGRGRLDAAVVMTNDLEPQTQKAVSAGVASDVTYAFRGGIEKGYVGFSRKNPRGEWARRQFDSGYDKILADGTADAIRRKWTPKPAP